MRADGEDGVSGAARSAHRVARYPFETGVNPYQSLFYEALGRHGIELVGDRPFTASALVRGRTQVGVLHFHWRLDRLYGGRATRVRIGLARLRLELARRLGYTIVWTIHELSSREEAGSREPIADALARAAHVLLSHDPDLADRAAVELGIERSRIDVVPHGPLAAAYPAPRETRAETRAWLGLDPGDTVFLAFGAIRQYKELDLVLEAFGRVADPTARLVVAGRAFGPELSRLLHSAAAADRRVVLLDEFVPATDVRALFAACDIAVLGRRDGWTSGALVLALSLGLPPVVSDRPAYVRLIQHGRAGWAFDPDGGAEALAATLREALDTPAAARSALAAEAVSATGRLTWEAAVALVARRLEDAAARSGRAIPGEPATPEAVVVDG